MLTDEEITGCIVKTWEKLKTTASPTFDVALKTAIRFADALADEKGRPEPPTPTRTPWPRGLWGPIEAGELPDVFDDTEREALALALNEFPAAVAILREDQRMWPKAVPETHPARTHFTNRDVFLARVDAAGFDL